MLTLASKHGTSCNKAFQMLKIHKLLSTSVPYLQYKHCVNVVSFVR